MRGGGLAAGAASLVCLLLVGPFLATEPGLAAAPGRPLTLRVASEEDNQISLDRRTGVRVEHTFVNDRVSSHPRVRVAGGAAGAACARAAACGARAGGRRRASARACDGGRRGRRRAAGNAAGGGALALPRSG